jgi:hypothetical protein
MHGWYWMFLPGAFAVGLAAGMIGNWLGDRAGARLVQQQEGGDGSVNIQAGRDIDDLPERRAPL